jgi:hypothetical protein
VITARSDVVGSLLRPRGLLEARQGLERGEIGPPEFKGVEDAAVEAAIRLQEDAGLAVVTDGEMRRLSFQSQLTEAVEGFSNWDLDALLWGDWHGDEVGNKRIKRPPIAVLGRLRRRRFLSAEEFTYARGRTKRILKVTLPAQAVRQLLRSAVLPRCLSEPGELFGRRRRGPARGGQQARAARLPIRPARRSPLSAPAELGASGLEVRSGSKPRCPRAFCDWRARLITI